jgi:hypothetical protein
MKRGRDNNKHTPKNTHRREREREVQQKIDREERKRKTQTPIHTHQHPQPHTFNLLGQCCSSHRDRLRDTIVVFFIALTFNVSLPVALR